MPDLERPEYRSLSIGEQMIETARAFAEERSWGVVEVGTGDMPRCKRSFDFYIGTGFKVTVSYPSAAASDAIGMLDPRANVIH